METNFEVRSFDSHLDPDYFKTIQRRSVYVIVEDLRSAFNVGSIFRTGDCALIETIYLCGITAHPPHKKLEKTALGVLDYMPWEYRATAVEAVRELQEKNIPVYALETTTTSQLLWEMDFPLPVALVLGNEALGISDAVLDQVDGIIEIPMLGFKNSINVGVAFGIAVYEIQRQHWKSLAKESWVKNRPGYLFEK